MIIILSGIRPAIGYSMPSNTANAVQSPHTGHSHTFTAMAFDARDIDVLNIHLAHGSLVIVTNYEFVSGSHVFLSGTTLGNVLTINAATRTAYIQNNTQLPEGFGHYEEPILFIMVSGEVDWVFQRANIHLENGNIGYAHRHINEFLAKDLNVHLPQGSVLNQITHEVGVLIPHE